MVSSDFRNFVSEIAWKSREQREALNRYETQVLSSLDKREECERAIEALDNIIFAAQHAKAEWEALWYVHDKELRDQTFNAPGWVL